MRPTPLPRNDPAQYDELADQWWQPPGGFAMLHWFAASRAEHIPPAGADGRVLVDLACGGGLMAPHAARLGYRHVGVDLGLPGLGPRPRARRAAGAGSVLAVPLADGCADVVVAGEILEHVEDDVGVLAECARLLRPGGTLVIDAIAATRLAALIAVGIARADPGRPAPGHPRPGALRRPRSGCWPPPTGWDSTSGWWGCGPRCGTRSPGGSAGERASG